MSTKPAEELLPAEVIAELCRYEGAGALSETLSRGKKLLSPAVVEQLAEVVRQRVRVDVEEALRLAEVALAIAQEVSNAESLGRGYRAKANALWFKGNCKEAAELFEIATAHFEQAGRADEVGRTLSSSIQSLVLLGEYDRAFRAAERAREIFLKLGDNWRLARVELNAANIHHRQDRFAEALSCYRRAYEQLLPYKDAEALGGALHNMAVCLIMLNDFGKAIECYSNARELCERNSMPLLVTQADYNIAYLYFLRGDYHKAIESLRKTRQLCRRNGDSYHAALCDLDESEIYLELNLTDEAEQMAREAGRQFEELEMAHELGRSVVNLAIALYRQNDTVGSLELLRRGKIIFAKENNNAWQALIDLYQALVMFDSGTLEPAKSLCRQALEFFVKSGLDRRAVVCHLLLARISLQTGCIEEARQSCDTAMRKVKRIEAPFLKYHSHLLQGHIQREGHEWPLAYDSYNKARVELETLRGHLQGEELKIAFQKNKLDVYESLVQLCLRNSSRVGDEEAFEYIQQAKSRSLAELLHQSGTDRNWLRDERIKALRGELNWFYHRIEIEQTGQDGISLERIQQLRAEVVLKENEFLHALRTLPGSSETNEVYPATGVMTLKQIRAVLPPDATLLEYFQIGSQFLVAVVTRENLNITQLAISSSEVTCHARMLEFQLSKFQLRDSYTRTFELDLHAATASRLQALYQALLEPLAPALKGRHLIVAPHGVLHSLPFHAFSDGEEYLIDRFTLSFAPSASVYAGCQYKPPVSGSGSLLLGVHDRTAPWIQREIRSVAAVVPEPRVFLGRRATMDVLRKAGPGSRNIHIATHGHFRRDNPAFSSVRLADSYLGLYDLYNLNLPVELLTLSGCGTGLNGITSGDELLGLTRGLLGAGAQTLLLTLWDVHDHTTAEFMESFYRHLQREDKSSALRTAMLELRKRHPHPYYWAPFVLVGKVLDPP
jgi:CHAT domain-containing protein